MGLSKKVLVVDDELGIRCLLTEILTQNGYDVSMAKDGQESLDQLGRESFDLVVTDIQMPGVDGIEVLQWIKKQGRKEKVIVMTGKPSDLVSLGLDMPQVVDFLQKPFKIENFVDIVSTAVADARA